jgi:uroporphyrinogen decarboxylase
LDFQALAFPQLAKLAERFPKKVAYYSKHTTAAHYAGPLSKLPWAGFGYDHRFDLTQVLRSERSGFVQGNFDQSLLFTPPAKFEGQLRAYLNQFTKLSEEQRAGWVCGLGHGVLPATPEENVRSFVKIVREGF